MASPISPSLQSMQHDKTYYIHSADLVVLVENVLFRVHRYFFQRESVYFQTLFETPTQENEPIPGSSDSCAIMLDTTASQFSRFVWVFYNPKFSLYDEATLDDWKSILELSHRWLFPQVKQLAIRELQKQHLSPVQRIELYHRNSVDRNFLVPEYLALCQRPTPLTLNEGLDLGLETTLMIARTREEIRSPRSPDGVTTPLTPTLQGPELIGLIGKLFVTAENNEVTPVIGQPATRPTIQINGGPEPKAERTPTATNLQGVNGHLNPNSAVEAANQATGANFQTEPVEGQESEESVNGDQEGPAGDSGAGQAGRTKDTNKQPNGGKQKGGGGNRKSKKNN